MNRIPIAQVPSSPIDKWDFIKLKSVFKAKDTIIRKKLPPTSGEYLFNNPLSDRGIISNIHKELKKLDSKHQIYLLKWSRVLKTEFSSEESQLAEKHLKKCSTF